MLTLKQEFIELLESFETTHSSTRTKLNRICKQLQQRNVNIPNTAANKALLCYTLGVIVFRQFPELSKITANLNLMSQHNRFVKFLNGQSLQEAKRPSRKTK